MSTSEVPSKGTIEQLRESLNMLTPQLSPDVEPAVVLTFEADEEEPEQR